MRLLVAGPSVFICNECIDQGNDLQMQFDQEPASRNCDPYVRAATPESTWEAKCPICLQTTTLNNFVFPRALVALDPLTGLWEPGSLSHLLADERRVCHECLESADTVQPKFIVCAFCGVGRAPNMFPFLEGKDPERMPNAALICHYCAKAGLRATKWSRNFLTRSQRIIRAMRHLYQIAPIACQFLVMKAQEGTLATCKLTPALLPVVHRVQGLATEIDENHYLKAGVIAIIRSTCSTDGVTITISDPEEKPAPAPDTGAQPA